METFGRAFVQTAQMSPQLWSLAAGAILLQIIIGVFVQLQSERLTEAYAQIDAISTLAENLTTEHAELYLKYDYFYVNNAELTFSSSTGYFCWPEFSVLAGETINFTAMASPKGFDDLIMIFFKDSAQVAYSHQEGDGSTIDDLSATIFYRGIVTSTDALFKFCIRGDAPIPAQRMQWGY